ncbi:MAG: hypothetical protein HYS05_14500 [Acidobacteria bacterium]|nr:hypothetical protein [Acidobacteriota bacterium]
MSLLINIVDIVLGSAGTIIVLFGETNRDSHLTRLGVVAVWCLGGALVAGIAQQVVGGWDDADKQAQIATLAQRAKETSDRLDQNKRELAAVRAENSTMRESLARMPQERATASIATGEPGREFLVRHANGADAPGVLCDHVAAARGSFGPLERPT